MYLRSGLCLKGKFSSLNLIGFLLVFTSQATLAALHGKGTIAVRTEAEPLLLPVGSSVFVGSGAKKPLTVLAQKTLADGKTMVVLSIGTTEPGDDGLYYSPKRRSEIGLAFTPYRVQGNK